MAQVNWNQFSEQFGESFIRTLERERTLRQQQEEFNRRMQFENRQLTLYTDIAKQRNEIEKEQSLGEMYRSGFTPDEGTPDVKFFGKGLDYPLPAPPKPEGIERTITDYTDPNKPVIFGITDSGQKVELGIGAPKTSKGDGSGKDKEDKIPYYDLTKSGKVFDEYRSLQNTWGEYPTKTGTVKGFKVGKSVVSEKEIGRLKDLKIIELEQATDDEARKINSKVPGFYRTYQAFLQKEIEIDGKKYKVTPDNIDELVNMKLGSASTETRDAIKTLLKRRIFK